MILITLNNFVQKGEKVKNISLVCKDINLKGTFSRYETLKQNLIHKDLDSSELIFFYIEYYTWCTILFSKSKQNHFNRHSTARTSRMKQLAEQKFFEFE